MMGINRLLFQCIPLQPIQTLDDRDIVLYPIAYRVSETNTEGTALDSMIIMLRDFLPVILNAIYGSPKSLMIMVTST